jgi:hypothetical protein
MDRRYWCRSLVAIRWRYALFLVLKKAFRDVVSFAIPSLWCQSQPLHSAFREFLDKFEKYLIQINMARFCLRIL